MNQVIMSGRFTRDIEIKVSQGEKPITVGRFGLAVDRRGKDTGVDFFNCVCFNKTAEFVEKYIGKGQRVIIHGRLSSDTYTNKDGQKVNSVQIIVEEIEFADSKRKEEQPQPQTVPAKEYMNIPAGIEEELPFA